MRESSLPSTEVTTEVPIGIPTTATGDDPLRETISLSSLTIAGALPDPSMDA